MTGLYVVVAAVAVAVFFGLYRKAIDGRATTVSGRNGQPRVDAAQLGQPLGKSATLLQFSTETCAPCKGARRVLGSVAERTPGVTHIDVDAEHRLDLAEQFGVLRTPTILVLDRSGIVQQRIVGAPRPADVEEALSNLGVPQAV